MFDWSVESTSDVFRLMEATTTGGDCLMDATTTGGDYLMEATTTGGGCLMEAIVDVDWSVEAARDALVCQWKPPCHRRVIVRFGFLVSGEPMVS